MANVLDCDAHAADAYIWRNLPTGTGGFKIKLWTKVTSALLAALYAAGPRETSQLLRLEHGSFFRVIAPFGQQNGSNTNYGWIVSNGGHTHPGSGVVGAPMLLDAWTVLEFWFLLTTGTNWNVRLFQDGVSLLNATDDLFVDDTLTTKLELAGAAAQHVTGEDYRVGAVEIRKADGTLILLEDFSSGSLATNSWTVQGAASIISDGSWPGLAPANTAAPVASGSAGVGFALTATTGSWTGTPTSYSYQWQRDNTGGGVYSNIAAATASSYTLTLSDLACNVRCVVTATNSFGSASANSNAVGPVALDITPPVLQQITTFRGKVVLVYDEPLDPAGPATGEFAVTVSGSGRAVTAVAVAGSRVILTLASPVGLGDTVDVDYTG